MAMKGKSALGGSINFNIFTDEDSTRIPLMTAIDDGEDIDIKSAVNEFIAATENNGKPTKQKATRSKSNKTAKSDDEGDLSLLQSNQAYIETYEDNNNELKNVVGDIDALQKVLNTDIQHVRTSKTMKKKYDYLSNLINAKSQLIGSKITAIKEIGNNITQSHNLELKRQKELKIDNSVDDEKQVLDLYKSFINTPQTSIPNFMNDRNIVNSPYNEIQAVATSNHVTPDTITPQQHMMLLEQNPDIKTVLVYEEHTGRKWFDVMNLATGESIPNVDLPNDIMLENINIDSFNNVARDSKLDIVYPLVRI